MQGRFEILSLSGSFTISETGGMRSRTGGISVSLAGPDGRVIGGGVAGLLLAASPIQVIIIISLSFEFILLVRSNSGELMACYAPESYLTSNMRHIESSCLYNHRHANVSLALG